MKIFLRLQDELAGTENRIESSASATTTPAGLQHLSASSSQQSDWPVLQGSSRTRRTFQASERRATVPKVDFNTKPAANTHRPSAGAIDRRRPEDGGLKTEHKRCVTRHISQRG